MTPINSNYASIKDEPLRMLAEDREYLWRAVDLLVQEIGTRGDCSAWFREQWADLVRERQATVGVPPDADCP